MSIEYAEQLAPNATTYDVQGFLDAWRSEPRTLVLRPGFQRNIVWNDDQRSYLVDSILRGLPVPELYLQKSTSPDGAQQIVVVDGQQRISTCIDFALGKFPLNTNRTELDSRWKGKHFDELSPDLRARFRNFGFIGRQLPTSLDGPALREVFQRLNRTVEALEPQELRHAAYAGEFLKLVEKSSESSGLDELGVFSAKDIQRRRHDEFISEVFFAFLLGTFPNKKEGLDDQYMIFERQGMPDVERRDLVQRFGRVDRFLIAHGAQLKKTRFRNKSDAYSLLVYLITHADRIHTGDGTAPLLVDRLVEFSALVNRIKKAEVSGESVDHMIQEDGGEDAAAYLRAVERAASDRNSRVRRANALNRVLSPLVSQSPPEPLRVEDESWTRLAPDEGDEGAEESELTKAELSEVLRVLSDEGDDTDFLK